MSELRSWTDDSAVHHMHLTISACDMHAMDREQIEMLSDAHFLIESALRGRVDGPLTLPATRLPLRN